MCVHVYVCVKEGSLQGRIINSLPTTTCRVHYPHSQTPAVEGTSLSPRPQLPWALASLPGPSCHGHWPHSQAPAVVGTSLTPRPQLSWALASLPGHSCRKHMVTSTSVHLPAIPYGRMETQMQPNFTVLRASHYFHDPKRRVWTDGTALVPTLV